MSLQQKYYVYGHINFPLIFPTMASSPEEAFKYVTDLLNAQTILKFEMDVHCEDKTHLIIADEFDLSWTHCEKIEE
jgi:hypothetical protein